VPGSFRIARILGIDVRVHLSWVLIFLYFSYGLAQAQFPSVFPTSEAKAFIAGAVTALLFFASVVAHEFAHAIVARRFRLPVSSITLFLLGGVASLTKEPTSAKGEFLMAVAGPATSLVIAGASLGGAAQLSHALLGAPWLLPAVAVAQVLGQVNLQVAIFNLLPGFPLDGGRVLRSAIWGLTGDRSRATAIAGRAGQLIAGLLLLLAAYLFFQLNDPGALLIGLVAFFLFNIAGQSMQQERLVRAVGGTRVAQLATTDFVVVPSGTLIGTLVRDYVLPRNLRAIPVVDNGRFVGLVTIADLRKVEQDQWPTTPVDAVMTSASAVPSVGPDDALGTVLDKFSEDLPLLPVVRDGALVGLLHRESVAGYVRMREMLGFDRR